MTSSTRNKRIVIIAGPNGAGKTTFAREFLPTDAELPNFVNADLIAAALLFAIAPFAVAAEQAQVNGVCMPTPLAFTLDFTNSIYRSVT
jgi:ABC-type hemin transport system ATPase subunit